MGYSPWGLREMDRTEPLTLLGLVQMAGMGVEVGLAFFQAEDLPPRGAF